MLRLRHVLLGVISVILLAGGAAQAAPFPATIPLPDGWAPEGITAGRGTTVFVGSVLNGAIWRGDVRTGIGAVFVDGVEGNVAVGTEYEARANRLWVAGGDTGEVRVYDATSGALLETYEFDAAFLNDLVVTRDAVYVTDSAIQQLAVIPLGTGGALPAPSEATTLPLSGDIVFVPNEFNANGIVAVQDALIVVQHNTGMLFRVDPATGVAEEIDLGGATVTFGDGLELHGGKLYVVRNELDMVDVFRLRPGLESATLVGSLSSGELDIPTTAAFVAGRLWAVNSRFGTPPTPTTNYDIIRLR